MTSDVAVVGAGVIGLSSAVRILEQCRGAKVTIIAKEFSPNTTTDISAGFWLPFAVSDTPMHLLRKWGSETFNFIIKALYSEKAKELGAQLVSGYHGFTYEMSEDTAIDLNDLLLGYRRLTEKEIEILPGYKSGFFYTTPQIDPTLLLAWLMRRFKDLGGRVIHKEISSLTELTGYDIVVNCSGICSKDLVKDQTVDAIRGQVIKVEAPWVKHFYVLEGDGIVEDYILPGAYTCVLGGTFQKGNWDKHLDEKDDERIYRSCCKIMPGLKKAKILKRAVGLRPSRTHVRLEKEMLETGHGTRIPVIHNYGHGGGGLSLFWGCAQDVVELLKSENHRLSSKL